MHRNNISERAFTEAKTLMPGGVNSPVRAFQSVGLSPIFMEKGAGAILTDVDGKEYIDYVLSWGPLILGHAAKEVVDSLQQVIQNGTSFGAPTILENKLAKIVIDRIPSVEKIRMVNSGTEATMSALRLARGYTNRNLIVKFAGNYHGHGDALLIKAGSGVATLGLPDSPGVPNEVARQTITVPYNDTKSIQSIFEKYGNDIAAVIVEPVAGNMGVIPPKETFLPSLRKITTDYGALLIFDEVMTGFRVDYDGAQGYYNIQPDITCFGKVIGGGLPVGAYGGRKEIMDLVAPVGPVYQAGTLSGNPLAMAAGITTLSALTKETYVELNRKVDRLVEGFTSIAMTNHIPLQINRVGTMFSMFFTDHPVVDDATAKQVDQKRFRTFYRHMLEAGIYLPPSPFEGMFISTAHTDDHIHKTLHIAETVFATL